MIKPAGRRGGIDRSLARRARAAPTAGWGPKKIRAEARPAALRQ
jgi:hypothetical protein